MYLKQNQTKIKISYKLKLIMMMTWAKLRINIEFYLKPNLLIMDWNLIWKNFMQYIIKLTLKIVNGLFKYHFVNKQIFDLFYWRQLVLFLESSINAVSVSYGYTTNEFPICIKI